MNFPQTFSTSMSHTPELFEDQSQSNVFSSIFKQDKSNEESPRAFEFDFLANTEYGSPIEDQTPLSKAEFSQNNSKQLIFNFPSSKEEEELNFLDNDQNQVNSPLHEANFSQDKEENEALFTYFQNNEMHPEFCPVSQGLFQFMTGQTFEAERYSDLMNQHLEERECRISDLVD